MLTDVIIIEWVLEIYYHCDENPNISDPATSDNSTFSLRAGGRRQSALPHLCLPMPQKRRLPFRRTPRVLLLRGGRRPRRLKPEKRQSRWYDHRFLHVPLPL